MVLLLVFRPHLVHDFRVVNALRADPDAAAGGARQPVAADAGAVRVKVAGVHGFLNITTIDGNLPDPFIPENLIRPFTNRISTPGFW